MSFDSLLGNRTDNLTGHGSAYDRGGADSYYRRGRDPHYYRGGSYQSERVEAADMNDEELAAYHRGFDDNEELGDFKCWQ